MTRGALIAAALEAAANKVLALDPEVAQRLGALSGKVLAIELRGTGTTLYLQPQGNRLEISDALETKPAATLSVSPMELTRRLASEDWTSGLEVRGDATCVQHYHTIFKALEIDWEEQLSRFVGDVAAHQVGNLVRDVLSWSSQAVGSLGRATTEYLQEESRDLPTPGEVERYLEGVDTLRADTDRLEARVGRLEQLLDTVSKPDRA